MLRTKACQLKLIKSGASPLSIFENFSSSLSRKIIMRTPLIQGPEEFLRCIFILNQMLVSV